MIHRDEVHGDIRYDRLSQALINTDQLQRLGRVYQLGFSHLVYRSGTHTRLSHSMGAYLMASRLVTGLQRNYETEQITPKGALKPGSFLPRKPGSDPPVDGDDPSALVDHWNVLRHLVGWAALLHDAGHIPVGHTLEDEYTGIYESHDDFTSPRLRYIWLAEESEIRRALLRSDLYPPAFGRIGLTDPEQVLKAVMLICTWKERVDDSGERTKFEEILSDAIASGNVGIAEVLLAASTEICGSLFSPYMAEIVANTISADYLDYLRRDPHNLGLDVLRDERVVSRFWVGEDGREQSRMALSLVDRRGKPRLDTCTSVVELVRQRFRFAEIVYYQKTKVAASAMLAKVFQLLGNPPEVPSGRDLPTIRDSADLAGKLFSDSASVQKATREAIRGSLPTSLLDPEVGDEGLGFLLRDRAMKCLDEAIANDDEMAARHAIESLALLADLARRHLYKTALTVDADLFGRLAGCDPKVDGALEQDLKGFISTLRGDPEARDELEKAMAEAAGWPDSSLLIYVPARRSQAKGIETGALDKNGKVVTLGMHFDVRDDVLNLQRKYAELWRCVIVVHPHHAKDAVGLSAALDVFMKTMFEKTKAPSIELMEEACWFPYLESRLRPAAKEFKLLIEEDDPTGWETFMAYSDENQNASSIQHARGAALLVQIGTPPGQEAVEFLAKAIGSPAEIEVELDRRLEKLPAEASREGTDPDLIAIRTVIATLAKELAERAPGDRLFP